MDSWEKDPKWQALLFDTAMADAGRGDPHAICHVQRVLNDRRKRVAAGVTKNGFPVDRTPQQTSTLTLMSHPAGAKAAAVHRQQQQQHAAESKVAAAGTARRDRDPVPAQHQELPVAGQPPANDAENNMTYVQQVDGTFSREKITTLATSAYSRSSEFQGKQTSSRINTKHVFDVKVVEGKGFSVATGPCLLCGLAQNSPALLVNLCFDKRAFPVPPEILVKYADQPAAGSAVEEDVVAVDGNQH